MMPCVMKSSLCFLSFLAGCILACHTAAAQAAPTVEQLYSQAQRAYLRGDNESATVLFRKVIAANPKHPGARNYLRLIAVEQQQAGTANPLENRLKHIVLPSMSFKDVSLSTATQYLKQQAEKLSDGAIKLNIILSLPPGYADSTAVSVELSDIPFLDALKYVCRLSKTKYSIERHGIVIEPDLAPTTAPEAQPPTDAPPTT